MLVGLAAVGSWKSESGGDGGTNYRVYAADGYSTSDAADAVENAAVPNGPSITISSTNNDWFWLGVHP